MPDASSTASCKLLRSTNCIGQDGMGTKLLLYSADMRKWSCEAAPSVAIATGRRDKSAVASTRNREAQGLALNVHAAVLIFTLEPEVAPGGIVFRGVPVAKEVMVDCIVHELSWSIASYCKLGERAEVEIMFVVNIQECADPMSCTREKCTG